MKRTGTSTVVEFLDRLHALEGLADVELGVLLGEGVDVVERAVAVQDLQRLAGLDAEDVRAVLAAVLVEGDRLGRHRVGPRNAFLDVDQDPLERIVRVDDDFLVVDRLFVLGLADRRRRPS